MPTASQCQILNALVRTEVERSTPLFLDDADPEDDLNTCAASNPPSPYPSATPSLLRDSPRGTLVTVGPTSKFRERPNTSIGVRERSTYHYYGRQQETTPMPHGGASGTQAFSPYQMDQPITGSYWVHRRSALGYRVKSANARLARLMDRHHNQVSGFQQQCMDMVEHTIDGGPGRRGMTAEVQEVHSRQEGGFVNRIMRRSLACSARATSVYVPGDVVHPQTRQSSAGVKPRGDVTQTPDANQSAAGHHSSVYEEIRNLTSTPTRPLVRFNSSVKVFQPIQSQLTNRQIGSDVAVAATFAANQSAAATVSELEISDTDRKDEDIDGTPQNLFPTGFGPKLTLPIVLTDEMRTRLWELGWRRPTSQYKKAKK